MVLHVHALADLDLNQPSIVTVGMFDGVHLGHQWLISQLVERAHSQQMLAAVLTFFPHPDVVLRGIEGRYYLTSPEERAERLGSLGVDVVVSHPFNADVRQMRASQFVDNMLQYLNLARLLATPDFALGYKREGDIAYLRQQGAEKGFSVETVDLLSVDQGDVVRSALIRDALQTGEIAKANQFLGRPYRVNGEVVHGEKRGRKIGFPTANVAIWDGKLLPANGVYACRAYLGDEVFMAVTNIGQRPTFDGQNITVEAHLLDFERDIYGEILAVEFVEYLRGEMKFDGIESLIAQIGRDVEQGRHTLTG